MRGQTFRALCENSISWYSLVNWKLCSLNHCCLHPSLDFLSKWSPRCDVSFSKRSWVSRLIYYHGLINYRDTKTKCRHLKKLTVKVLCGRCLLEFVDWRYSQSCWYFRPSFVNYCPSNLLSGSLPPPLHPCVKVQCIKTVSGWEGVGAGVWVLSPVGEHVLQEFNTLYLTRLRTSKIARPPETIT